MSVEVTLPHQDQAVKQHKKDVATNSSNFILRIWPLNFPHTDQILFYFLQLSDYQLFLVPTEYEILNSLPPVHMRSARTKVFIYSLSKPVCEWCSQHSVCPPNAASVIDVADSSIVITTWGLEAGTNNIQVVQYFWWCQERTIQWHWRVMRGHGAGGRALHKAAGRSSIRKQLP